MPYQEVSRPGPAARVDPARSEDDAIATSCLLVSGRSYLTVTSGVGLDGIDRVVVAATLPPALAASQVIWRALGPRDPHRVTAIQDWAGLLGGPIAPLGVVAARHGVTRATLVNWRTAVVELAKHRVVLPPALADRFTRPTQAGENHQARVRQAFLVGLRVTGTAPPTPASSRSDVGVIRVIRRILAALGTLPVNELTVALNRTWPRSSTRIMQTNAVAELVAAAADMTIVDGRARLTAPTDALPQDLALIDAARRSGRILHTYSQVRELLTTAGYERSLSPTMAYHPLLLHVRSGLWAVRTPGRSARGTFR